jgi:hypothetical protein
MSEPMTRRDVIKFRLRQINTLLATVPSSRVKSLVHTKLDEAELWLSRIEDKEIDEETTRESGSMVARTYPSYPPEGRTFP